MSHWYLIHTKPRQERVALENLQRQGFECFLPLIHVERMQRSKLQVVQEPLFPRYLFIRLDSDRASPSWSPIRSTVGVTRMVAFGQSPARIDDSLVHVIRERTAGEQVRQRHFEPGAAVVVTQGPFAGVEAIYEMADGEGRVMVLLEMLSKQVRIALPPQSVQRLD